MSASNPAATLLCCNAQCGQAFGGAVRFCPFCGTRQTVAAAAPAPATKPPPPSPPPAQANPSPWSLPPASGRRASDTVPKPPVAQPAAVPAKRHGLRRALVVGGLLALAAGAWLYRHHAFDAVGKVVVITAPPLEEAAVTLDDVEAGRTGQPFEAPAGDHRIGLRAAHWSAEPLRVTIGANQLSRVTLTAKPDPATLQVRVQPSNAILTVDGRRVGRTPATLSFAPGARRLSAEAEGFRPATQTVVLTAGEQRSLTLQLDLLPEAHTRIVAPAGSWSPPVQLEAGSDFSLVFKGRVRARIGGQVIFLGGENASLGTVDAQKLQLKPVGDRSVVVDLLTRHAVP